MSRQLRLVLGAAFLLLSAGCIAGLIFIIANTPLLNQPVSGRTAVVWSGLPHPAVTKPNWHSYTNPHTIMDVAQHDGLLWAATNGGVVVWDLQTKQALKLMVEHGLAENVVTSTAVGPDGALWFGTSSSGLSRFDGTSWQTFNTADGLPSNAVRDIVTSADGYVWVATDQGIGQYDGRRWFTHNRPRSFFQLPAQEIQALALAPDGVTIWAATPLGAARYNGTRWESMAQVGSTAVNDLLDITITPDGTVWAATAGGLTRFDGREWHIFTSGDGLAGEDVKQVVALPDNTLWLAYQDPKLGLTHFDATTTPPSVKPLTKAELDSDEPLLSVFNLPGGLAVTAPNRLLIAENGSWQPLVPPADFPSATLSDLVANGNQIWISGENGVGRFDGQDWQFFTQEDGLASAEVAALTVDSSDNVWLAYADAAFGLSRFDEANGRFQTNTCQQNPGPPSLNIRQGVQAPDGTLWFAGDLGLSQFDGRQWRTFSEEDGLPASAIQTLDVAPDGTVWAGTAVGLAKYDSSRWQTVLADDIRLLTVAGDGSVYFITESTIARWQNGRSNLPNPPVSQVYDLLARDDGLWLAAEEGLYHYDGRAWQPITSLNNLPAARTRALTQTDTGTLVAATETNLATSSHHLYGQYDVQHNYISRYHDGQWQTNPLPLAYGLPHRIVTDILVDDGTTWFATLGGIAAFDGSQWQTFTLYDGLPSAEVYSLAAAYGTIWATTQVGIVHFVGDEAARPWQPVTELQDKWAAAAELHLAVNSDGTLWAGGGNELMAFDGDTWQIIDLQLPHNNFQIRSLAFSEDGKLWLAAQDLNLPDNERHFLGVWDGSQWNWNQLQPPAQFVGVDLMRFAPDGRLWLGNDNGLWLLDIPDGNMNRPWWLPDTREPTDLLFLANGAPLVSQRYERMVKNPLTQEAVDVPLIDATNIFALATSSDGTVWIGSDQGAARLLENGTWDIFPVYSSQKPPVITRMTAVNETALLLGTFGGEVINFADGAITIEYEPLTSAFARAPVSSLILADDQTLWLSSFGAGIARRIETRWQQLNSSGPLQKAQVNDVAISASGIPWLATSEGIILQKQSDSGIRCQLVTTELEGAIEAIAVDLNEQIWLVNAGRMWQGDETGFELSDIQAAPITAVAANGAVWGVSLNNLVRHLNGRRQTISSEGIPADITALAIAPNNTIWVGTTAGTAFYNGREWEFLTAVDGLSGNHILHIAIAADNSVWFATDGGLSHLSHP